MRARLLAPRTHGSSVVAFCENSPPETVPAPVDGMYVEHVAGLALRDVSVAYQGGARPGWSMQCINATGDSQVTGGLEKCTTQAQERAFTNRKG